MPRTKGNSTSNESKGPSDAGVKKSRSAKKIFMDHERKKLTGDVNEKEFKKNFTSKWKEMSKEEKKVLLLNVPADVYQKFFELQKAEKGTAASTKSKESKKSKKSKKDPNAPKKAQSGYNFYMKENMHLVGTTRIPFVTFAGEARKARHQSQRSNVFGQRKMEKG